MELSSDALKALKFPSFSTYKEPLLLSSIASDRRTITGIWSRLSGRSSQATLCSDQLSIRGEDGSVSPAMNGNRHPHKQELMFRFNLEKDPQIDDRVGLRLTLSQSLG